MQNIDELIKESRRNRESKKMFEYGSCRFIFGKHYAAIIKDVEYETDRNRIAIKFVLFNTSSGTEQTYYFYTQGRGLVYYNNICDIFDTTGEPSELIGRFCLVTLEQTGEYVNIRVVSEILEDELKKMVLDIKALEDERMNKFIDVKDSNLDLTEIFGGVDANK